MAVPILKPRSTFRRACILAGGGLVAVLLLSIRPAAAGVMAESTRVIFPSGAAERSLQLANLNAYPVVVQAWVDDGELTSEPENSTAPIIPLPPIFRMNAGDQLSLRLLHARAPLPTDRESLFWLNLYEIPPRPLDVPPDSSTLTVAIRTQMKIIVRPPGLPMAPGEVADKLVFSIRGDAERPVLQIENPTPYFASIGVIRCAYAEEAATQQIEGLTIAPYGSADTPLQPPAHAQGEAAAIVFTLINDEGTALAHARAIKPGPGTR